MPTADRDDSRTTERPTPGTWTTVPQRHFQDHFARKSTQAAEQMREIFQQVCFANLESSSPSVYWPPLKGFSPRQPAGYKDLHKNRSIEIGIVTRGEMTIWWEGVTTRCPTGSIFVIPPGIRYMPHVQATEKTQATHSVLWLVVHKSYAVAHACTLEGNRHLLSEYYSFTNSLLMPQGRILSQELAERSPYYEAAVRGSLLCLFTWLVRTPAQPLSQFRPASHEASNTDQDEFSERVKAYLLSHYHQPLTLAQVARAIGCSSSYLCRQFRVLNGITPFHFLMDVRVEAAKRLLNSEMSIARVATMVGFNDPLYFSKVFSKKVGESPRSFRAHNASRSGG